MSSTSWLSQNILHVFTIVLFVTDNKTSSPVRASNSCHLRLDIKLQRFKRPAEYVEKVIAFVSGPQLWEMYAHASVRGKQAPDSHVLSTVLIVFTVSIVFV